MCFSPVLFHEPFNIVVLRTIISASSTRPPILLNGRKEDGGNSSSSFVGAADKVDDEPREAVDTAMDIEAPWLELLIAVNVPKGIRATNFVDTSFDDACPSKKP